MSEGGPKNERDSAVSRIVGLTEEQEASAHTEAADIFEDQSSKTVKIGERIFNVEDLERKKTPEEKELIAIILSKMPEFVAGYGGRAVKLSEDHIHFLDINKLDDEIRERIPKFGEAIPGYEPPKFGAPSEEIEPDIYSEDQQFVSLFSSGGDLQTVLSMVHEIIHFNSFHSYEKDDSEEGGTVRSRRFGLSTISYKKPGYKTIYFDDMNEAITTELAIRFVKKYFDESLQLSEQSLNSAVEYSYPKARDILDASIEDLSQDNPLSKEDVFSIFARAAMSGNLIELYRLAKKTYGAEVFSRIREANKKEIKIKK